MEENLKQLLIKDLCARLPYGVIVNYKEGEYDFHKWKIKTLYAPAYSESGLLIETNCDGLIGYTEYKGCGMSSASRALHLDKNLPYLRPMSSMTEEERSELSKLTNDKFKFYLYTYTPEIICYGDYNYFEGLNILDWLNSHHFDYRGLIEKELALEAPEGMYKTK